MDNSVFWLDSTKALKKQAKLILNCVGDNGYALIRGLFPVEAIRHCAESVYHYANSTAHQASAGISRRAVRTNMSKWSIGGISSSQGGIARFMLTIYNPLSSADTFDLHPHFRKLIEIRDILAMRERMLTDENLSPPLFNATRIQIYPGGGGFMTAHRDTRAAENVDGISKTYIQLVLLLTERGVDYRSGGAYVQRHGMSIDTERGTRATDVLVYDGNSLHGVQDVDPELSFNSSDLSGRAVALATIYT